MVAAIWILARLYYGRTPAELGLAPDGGAPGAAPRSPVAASARPLPGPALRRDICFVTLAAGMALSLFAQIGLIAHLYSLLVPALGAQIAGFAAALATAAAIGGRTIVGWAMPAGADRRRFAAVNLAVQVAGCAAFLLADGQNPALLLLGVVLFGAGIGNVTSLPPLIAQTEFVPQDTARVVPAIVAIGQAGYAFAPAAFGLLRALGPGPAAAPWVFAAAAGLQIAAAVAFLSARRR